MCVLCQKKRQLAFRSGDWLKDSTKWKAPRKSIPTACVSIILEKTDSKQLKSPIERSNSYSKFEHLLESNQTRPFNVATPEPETPPSSSESEDNPFIASGTKSTAVELQKQASEESQEERTVAPETAKRRESLKLIQFRGGSGSTSGSTAEYGGISPILQSHEDDPSSTELLGRHSNASHRMLADEQINVDDHRPSPEMEEPVGSRGRASSLSERTKVVKMNLQLKTPSRDSGEDVQEPNSNSIHEETSLCTPTATTVVCNLERDISPPSDQLVTLQQRRASLTKSSKLVEPDGMEHVMLPQDPQQKIIVVTASQSTTTTDENTIYDDNEIDEETAFKVRIDAQETSEDSYSTTFRDQSIEEDFTSQEEAPDSCTTPKLSPIRSSELKRHGSLTKPANNYQWNYEDYPDNRGFYSQQQELSSPRYNYAYSQEEYFTEDEMDQMHYSQMQEQEELAKQWSDEYWLEEEANPMMVDSMRRAIEQQDQAWTNMYSLSAQVIESAKEFSAKLDELSYDEDDPRKFVDELEENSSGSMNLRQPSSRFSPPTLHENESPHSVSLSSRLPRCRRYLWEDENDSLIKFTRTYRSPVKHIYFLYAYNSYFILISWEEETYEELVNYETGRAWQSEQFEDLGGSGFSSLERVRNEMSGNNGKSSGSAVPSPSASEISNATTVLQRQLQSCHSEASEGNNNQMSSITPTSARRRSLTRSLALGEAPEFASLKNTPQSQGHDRSPAQAGGSSTETPSTASTGNSYFFGSQEKLEEEKRGSIDAGGFLPDNCLRLDSHNKSNEELDRSRGRDAAQLSLSGAAATSGVQEGISSTTRVSLNDPYKLERAIRSGENKSSARDAGIGYRQVLSTSQSEAITRSTPTDQSAFRSQQSNEYGEGSLKLSPILHIGNQAEPCLTPELAKVPKTAHCKLSNLEVSTPEKIPQFTFRRTKSKLDILDQTKAPNLTIDEELALIDQISVDCSKLGQIHSPTSSVDLLSNFSEENTHSSKVIEEDDVTLPELNPLSPDLSIQTNPTAKPLSDQLEDSDDQNCDFFPEQLRKKHQACSVSNLSKPNQVCVPRSALTPDLRRPATFNQNEICDFIETLQPGGLAEIRSLEEKLIELRSLEQEQIDEIQAKIAAIMSSPSAMSSSSIDHRYHHRHPGTSRQAYSSAFQGEPTTSSGRMLPSRGGPGPPTRNTYKPTSRRYPGDISLDEYTTSGPDSGGSGGNSYPLRSALSSRHRGPSVRMPPGASNRYPISSEFDSGSEYLMRHSNRMRRGSWHMLNDKNSAPYRSSWSDHGEDYLDDLNARSMAGVRSSLGAYGRSRDVYDSASLQRSRRTVKSANMSRSTEQLSSSAVLPQRMRPTAGANSQRSASLNRYCAPSMDSLRLKLNAAQSEREQDASTERLRRQVEREHRKLLKSLMEDEKNGSNSYLPSSIGLKPAVTNTTSALIGPMLSIPASKNQSMNSAFLANSNYPIAGLPPQQSVYVPGPNPMYPQPTATLHPGLLETGLNPNSLLAQTLANSEALDNAITSNQITLAAIAGTIAAMASQNQQTATAPGMPQGEQDRLLGSLLGALNRNQNTLDFQPTPEVLQLLAAKLKDGSIKASDIPNRWLGISDDHSRDRYRDHSDFDHYGPPSTRSSLVKKTRWSESSPPATYDTT
ncbi:hypothetical protein Ciccas_003782 [Cichlidogyrus casuarinus]|uniref:Uncharacterized protein n=1 Tax=Cichlidogyrus casuarinus TaxID=1844966 RepID=A0ABD2QFM6_9PLAT